VRVIVADDAMLTRVGIVRLLGDAGIEVASEAETVEAHTTQIFRKLGLDADPGSHRRVLAVLAFLRSPA
jgi:DNA-binding NarL/FixJ family response regulator